MESLLLAYCLICIFNAFWCIIVNSVIGKKGDKALIAVWCLIPIFGQVMFISSLVAIVKYQQAFIAE